MRDENYHHTWHELKPWIQMDIWSWASFFIFSSEEPGCLPFCVYISVVLVWSVKIWQQIFNYVTSHNSEEWLDVDWLETLITWVGQSSTSNKNPSSESIQNFKGSPANRHIEPITWGDDAQKVSDFLPTISKIIFLIVLLSSLII